MDSETCYGVKLFSEIIALLWMSDNIEIVVKVYVIKEMRSIITIGYGASNVG